MVTNVPGAGRAIKFGFGRAGAMATVVALGATPAGCGGSGTNSPSGGLEDEPQASSPSAAARRISATIDRVSLRAYGHPEISRRANDLHVQWASAEVVLPSSPEARFHLKDLRSSARISVRMLDAMRTTAEVVGGRVVYPGGHAKGDVVYQLLESGTEDFVILRERGTSALDYELELEQGIAGLRLVESTLELLDARGAPRLRVAAPYVVDDAGSRIAARLSLDGCAYDTSPAAPWGRPVTRPGAGSCRVHVAWSDAGLRYPLVVDPAWLATNNLLQDRDGLAGTVLANGLVLFSGGVHWNPNFGGASCSGTYYPKSAELFDPATSTFAVTGSTTYGHVEHRSATLTSGQALVAGTETGGSYSSIELYDPVAGTWSFLTTSNGEPAHPALAPLPGGGAMLIGGSNAVGTVLKTTMVYTPGTGWAIGPSMATSRVSEDAVLLDDNSILVVGGNDQSGNAIGTSERYVPGVGWDAPVSLAVSAGATYHTTARLGSGKFLVAMPSASQIYDPSMKQWSSITSTSVYTAKSASLGNGKVLVLGGTSTQAPVAQLFDETSGWVSAPTPTVARYPTDDTLVALATGDALVAGGVPITGCASTNDAEVFKYCPPFTFTPASLPAGSVTVAYSQSLGSSGSTGAVTYAITSGSLPTGLTLASDGTLSGTPSVGGTFPFIVKATDADACTGSKTYSFNVTCPAITVSPTTLPYGRGGTAYDQTISSTGDIGAATYAVTSGALPAGLTLTSDGTLSGTPGVAGTFPFTVTATDTATCKGSQSYSLPIYCPSFTFSPSSPLADGTAGTPYTVVISVTGGLGAVTYTVGSGAGTPPPGMTLASDGTLGGTPTQPGTFVWIVSATDSSLCMHSALFELIIDQNPDAGSGDAGSDAGSPDAGFDAAVEAGTDAASLADGAPTGNDAATGTGTDAAADTDSATSADAATAETGIDAAIIEAGADAAVVDLGEDSSAPTDANVAQDSDVTGTTMTDAPAAVGESGSLDQQDGAMEGATTNEASAEKAALSENGGCSCRQSRHTGSSWPLGGIAIVFLAARRRSSARQGGTRGRPPEPDNRNE